MWATIDSVLPDIGCMLHLHYQSTYRVVCLQGVRFARHRVMVSLHAYLISLLKGLLTSVYMLWLVSPLHLCSVQESSQSIVSKYWKPHTVVHRSMVAPQICGGPIQWYCVCRLELSVVMLRYIVGYIGVGAFCTCLKPSHLGLLSCCCCVWWWLVSHARTHMGYETEWGLPFVILYCISLYCRRTYTRSLLSRSLHL
jgi:hypothetical protein